MDRESLLFVVLHRPINVAKNTPASSFLSSKEFKGADDKNTIWLENWGTENNEKLDISTIKRLTIIRPPGEIVRTDVKWVTFIGTFSSGKIFEKLTYVWVTEKGEKFRPSPATKNIRYEGLILSLSGLEFESARFEAFPSEECLTHGPILETLKLSEITGTVELHDLYASRLVFGIPEQGSNLKKIEITGDTTFIKQLSFCGAGLKSLEDRIKNGLLIITKGKMDEMFKIPKLCDMKWDNNGKSTCVNDFRTWIF
jgi:hypothetical protein